MYYFFPALVLLYVLVPTSLKNVVLLLASMIFYAWGERLLVLLFAASIILNWCMGLLIEKTRKTGWDKVLVWASVVIDLSLLGYFKYADFFLDSVNHVLGMELPLLHVALPIGISFYTFQLLSYTVDVYRGDVSAQKNLIHFMTYVSFFPQLIAGPIVRYADVEKQLTERRHSLDMTADGVRRFLTGLGKKILLANIFGELCVFYRQTGDPSVLYHWIYAVSYMLQIYFDFSGYSDMAIGLGKMFGFTFMENFNYPYISGSITEFWRRWHISLGSWFRDYVYIPLGGNRRGMVRQLFNILVVWTLTGLWHGAAWNFVVWGMLYAVLLTIEKLWLKKWLDSHRIAGHIYVLLAVMIGFVIFNASDFGQAAADLTGMIPTGGLPLVSAESLYYLRSYGMIIFLGIIGATPLPKQILSRIMNHEKMQSVRIILEPVLFTLLLVTVSAYLVDGSFNPFLYFRF